MIVKEIEKKKKFIFKKDFFVTYSPERIDPANKKFQIKNIPKVIGSNCAKSIEFTNNIYKKIFKKTYLLNNFEEAELSKLIENVFRQVNIGLMNEMAMMCEKLEINIWNTIKASSTKPFGFMPFYPGPGTGGHCIPLDPNYLSWKARSKNFFSKYIDLSNEINQKMPSYVVNRVLKLLNKVNKSVRNSKLLVVGLSYKKNISDYRESPALRIFQELYFMGSDIEFHDDHVKKIKLKKDSQTNHFLSIKLTKEKIKSFDAVIILTDHSYINWKVISKHSKIIFDTRFICKNDNLNVEYL
jgi:UDP-N-acetyl-D-glucosamine dehydrogenase